MIDWKHINTYINEADSILLTMHENPDGDGKPMILVENMDGELEEVQDILERVSNV